MITGGGRLRSASYRLGPERIPEALREVAEQLGHAPRTNEYMNAREAIYRESERQGHPRALPAYGTIARHFPRWDQALIEAGLEPTRSRETRMSNESAWTGPRHSDDAIRWALREACDQIGEPFTQRAYEGWRRGQIAREARRAHELPSANSIGRRFGRWNAAREAAFDTRTPDHV